ncbi:MAG: glycosyltransferase [Deltaproteobacteria bacterium]|nr:MAG: glycosyltransferase [Deltaproteobacteria bacterium]
MRIGIHTDFPSVAVQSGPAIHTRFLFEGMSGRGHDVVLMGPQSDGAAPPSGASVHLFRGVPYPSHPKVRVAVPWPPQQLVNPPRLDVIHGQVSGHNIHYSTWMRKMWGTAVLNTHIIHLPTHSHFLVSDGLYANPLVREVLRHNGEKMERSFARMYNEGDAFIVQSRHMVDYWRERGVTVPIEVVGRPINPTVFSRSPGADPFPKHFVHGKRLLVVCRHDREKNLDDLLDLFVEAIAPADEEVTLTLVGGGFHHDNLRARAEASGYGDRIHFPGEARHEALVDWYAHADLFVYTSISETFGNVVNEALWTGLPVVAYDDGMGVAHQVVHGSNGLLVPHNRTDSHERFGSAVLDLLQNRERLADMAGNAATHARRVSHPDAVLSRFERIYEAACRHCARAVPRPLSGAGHREKARAFAAHMGQWAFWSGALLAVSGTAFRLGASRSIEQDTSIVPEALPKVEDLEIPAELDGRTPAARRALREELGTALRGERVGPGNPDRAALHR